MDSEHGGSDCEKTMIEEIKLLKIEIAGQKRGEEALWASYQALAAMDTGGFRQDMERTCRAELELEMQAMKYKFELLCKKAEVQAESVRKLRQEQADEVENMYDARARKTRRVSHHRCRCH